jgi:hypothetical protein
MFRRLVLSVLPLAVAAAAAGAACAAANAEFPEISFDAGEVRLGTDIEHDFIVRNTGDEPLLITNVSVTCGCTVVDYAREIPPGGEGKIKARIKTKELPSGRASKTITVTTNAPNAERVVLQVKLDHMPPVEFGLQGRGQRLYLAQVKGADPNEEKVLVRPHLPGMKIVGVTSSNPLIEVGMEPAKPSGKTGSGLAAMLLPQAGDVWVSVKVRPDAPLGPQAADVTVKTSDAAYPAASFKVQASVQAPKPQPPA